MSKKLFIETLGCAMNSRDSEHMIAQLREKEGYETLTHSTDKETLTQTVKEIENILTAISKEEE